MTKKRVTHQEAADKSGSMFLTIAQVATIMNVSQRTVCRWVESGACPKPIQIGHIIRWNSKEFEAWIKAGCKPIA